MTFKKAMWMTGVFVVGVAGTGGIMWGLSDTGWAGVDSLLAYCLGVACGYGVILAAEHG